MFLAQIEIVFTVGHFMALAIIFMQAAEQLMAMKFVTKNIQQVFDHFPIFDPHLTLENYCHMYERIIVSRSNYIIGDVLAGTTAIIKGRTTLASTSSTTETSTVPMLDKSMEGKSDFSVR